MARKSWEPKITRARFVAGPFSSEQMATLGTILADSVRTRILLGLNGNDMPAKPLKESYSRMKIRGNRAPIRDWNLSGRTLLALRMLAANENRAQVGFNNPVANRIAHWNNLRERAFTVSPKDRQTIVAAVRATTKESRVVTVRRIA